MQLGIFAKTFLRPTVEEVFAAVRAHGLDCVQFNMSCAGLASMPSRIDENILERIRKAAIDHDINIAALSGTFNMIHPDRDQRTEGLHKLEVLAEACNVLGVPIITLCTGTRDPDDMWRRHPDNDADDAWYDLIDSLRGALGVVSGSNLILAFEPEAANVIDSASKARRLLDEMASSQLQVVLDGANLLNAKNIDQMKDVLSEAFYLLGSNIVLVHAKDIRNDGQVTHVAAGTGQLDYDHYLHLLRAFCSDAPLVLHGLTEEQVNSCVAFVRDRRSFVGFTSTRRGTR